MRTHTKVLGNDVTGGRPLRGAGRQASLRELRPKIPGFVSSSSPGMTAKAERLEFKEPALLITPTRRIDAMVGFSHLLAPEHTDCQAILNASGLPGWV